MSWIESLYQTYENCAGKVGDSSETEPLLPLSHTTQNAQIEVMLDGSGRFRRARILPKAEQRTVIPCTESSGGRTGSKPMNHPLCDKLQYLASDFLEFGGVVTSGFETDPEEPHKEYMKLLGSWCASPFGNLKVKAVLTYVRNGGLIRDLVGLDILPLQPGKSVLLAQWQGRHPNEPAIFGALPEGCAPLDAFVRWAVEIPGDLESRLWQDGAVWESWNAFYQSSLSVRGFCYVRGVDTLIALQHPAKLRHAGDKAKLISSNDSSGFTFRGRFTDPAGQQVCSVSFDVTQKAHNALRWLIARQGHRDGDQAIVAWSVTGNDVPPIMDSTDSLMEEEDFLRDAEGTSSALVHAETAQDFALRLKKKIGGYRAVLGNADRIVILALNSATPGRMAITYYREIASSEFLERLEKWHVECAWFQDFGKDRRFIGAPSPKDIAVCAYGRRLDDKLQAATQRRLLPCIIEALPIPRDIVAACVTRATARHALEVWEWERALGIACALYRKQHLTSHNHPMALDRERKTRSYLYGRLLAVADHLEGSALRKAAENRNTNAARLMQRFADLPFSTWRTIEMSLDPYRRRLLSNSHGLLTFCDKEVDQIMNLFVPDEFKKDEKLDGEFLLAFHTQRSALWTRQPREDTSFDDSADTE